MRPIAAFSVVMQSHFFSFHYPRYNGFGKKANYVSHPRKIRQNCNIKPHIHQMRSEKPYNLKVRRLYRLFILNFLCSAMHNRSLKLYLVFFPMHIDEGFCNQAVFVQGLANLQSGAFYVIDNLQTALLP
jgi:hypothetical protein